MCRHKTSRLHTKLSNTESVDAFVQHEDKSCAAVPMKVIEAIMKLKNENKTNPDGSQMFRITKINCLEDH